MVIVFTLCSTEHGNLAEVLARIERHDDRVLVPSQNVDGAINNKEDFIRYVTPFQDEVLGQVESGVQVKA